MLSLFLSAAQSTAVSHPEDQTAENILASVAPGKVKTIVKKVADEVLGNFQVSVAQLSLVRACLLVYLCFELNKEATNLLFNCS